ncbi:adenylate kinase [Candidatus Woesearchaeota archaeon]|nr:adenylate kinase [Candidatus Woesearchaeota archaeon]
MRIVLLGAPGVGKGTTAAMLARKYKAPHIATGDIFKDEIRKGTELGKKVRETVEKGNLVSDELTNAIMKERLSKPDAKEGFLLDGYPRTIAQAEEMEKFAKPELALNFVADRKTIITRLSGRRICAKCGTIYHVENNPPKKEGVCDKCGEKLTKRKDDEEKVISNRLDVYEEQTKPLISYYRKKKMLAEINASHGMNKISIILAQCDDAISKAGKA